MIEIEVVRGLEEEEKDFRDNCHFSTNNIIDNTRKFTVNLRESSEIYALNSVVYQLNSYGKNHFMW